MGQRTGWSVEWSVSYAKTGNRVWDSIEDAVIESRDVRFNENDIRFNGQERMDEVGNTNEYFLHINKMVAFQFKKNYVISTKKFHMS